MNLQLILVILFSAGAIFFLSTRFYKTVSGKGKNGDCPNCGISDVKTPHKK